MPGTDSAPAVSLNVDGVGASEEDGPPRWARYDRAVTFVRAMVERELDRLMTGRGTDTGLRLRVLMRTADQLMPAR